MENNATMKINPITEQPYTAAELEAFTGAYGKDALKNKVKNMKPKVKVKKIEIKPKKSGLSMSEELLAQFEANKDTSELTKNKRRFRNGGKSIMKAGF